MGWRCQPCQQPQKRQHSQECCNPTWVCAYLAPPQWPIERSLLLHDRMVFRVREGIKSNRRPGAGASNDLDMGMAALEERGLGQQAQHMGRKKYFIKNPQPALQDLKFYRVPADVYAMHLKWENASGLAMVSDHTLVHLSSGHTITLQRGHSPQKGPIVLEEQDNGQAIAGPSCGDDTSEAPKRPSKSLFVSPGQCQAPAQSPGVPGGSIAEDCFIGSPQRPLSLSLTPRPLRKNVAPIVKSSMPLPLFNGAVPSPAPILDRGSSGEEATEGTFSEQSESLLSPSRAGVKKHRLSLSLKGRHRGDTTEAIQSQGPALWTRLVLWTMTIDPKPIWSQCAQSKWLAFEKK